MPLHFFHLIYTKKNKLIHISLSNAFETNPFTSSRLNRVSVTQQQFNGKH